MYFTSNPLEEIEELIFPLQNCWKKLNLPRDLRKTVIASLSPSSGKGN